MGSSTVAVRVIGVSGASVELWVAEVPRGADGSFPVSLGEDHPAFALQLIAGANHWNNALASALSGVDPHDPAWLEAHATDYVEAMELVAAVPLGWRTGAEVAAQVQGASSDEEAHRLTLELAPRVIYRITMRDPSWVAHLAPGAEFGSTAHSPLRERRPKWTMQLASPAAWDPILGVLGAPMEPSTRHAFRRTQRAGSWLFPNDSERIMPSNRLRELFLRLSGATLAYFDATAPKFNPAKLVFTDQDKPLPSPVVKLRMKGAPAGPYGFDLRSGFPVRGKDGVPRAILDHLAPDNKCAWVDYEGEPLVRLGGLDGVDPESPAVDVADYLRATAERVRAHLV